jgi:hypothetical protein
MASPALAHAVCGSRVFPATLGIDDPGVGDEIALPTITYLPGNGDGVNEADISIDCAKTILPGFGVCIGNGETFLNGREWGRADLSVGVKDNMFCQPDWEFMGSGGVNMDIGKTYTNDITSKARS